MYHALREAGHELLLIVRPSVAPLVECIAPATPTILLPTEVYRDDLEEHWPLFDETFRGARDFQPDMLLVAPYQWTQFEERLSDELRHLIAPVRRIGMSGRLYAGDPHVGRSPTSNLIFDETVDVPEDLPEVEKNAALTAAILGCPTDQVQTQPRIDPGQATLAQARSVLEQLGVAPGEYWIACVTGTIHVPIKAWQLEKWAQLLSHWVGRYGRQFLFIGLPQERQAVEDVRRMMGDAANRTRVCMNDDAALTSLIGLTAHSRGYAGHDTGPMHLAAALGKPVLAVFGGGHKLRFAPRSAGGSVILTVGVPCTGCAWTCPFEISHCVKDVTAEQVIRAADDLESGRVSGEDRRVVAPDDALRNRMIREAADFARERLRDTGERGRQLREQELRTIQPLRIALEERSREAAAAAVRLGERETLAAKLQASLETLTSASAEQAASLRQQETENSTLSEALALRTREAEELRRSVSAKERAAEQLRRKIVQLELAGRPAQDASSQRQRTLFPLSPSTWRQFVADLMTGQRHFVPRTAPRPLPKVTLVMPIPSWLGCDCQDCGTAPGNGPDQDEQRHATHACRTGDIAAARQTIESVLAQDYPRLDLVVAPFGGATNRAGLAWLEPHANRLNRILQPCEGPFEAIANAFASSDADVLGWLQPGDLLQPGAMQNVGEFFRDHPHAAGAIFDEVADVGPWRLTLPRPRLDVYSLLHAAMRALAASPGDHPAPDSQRIDSRPDDFYPASVWVRGPAYRALGRLRTTRGRASGWDFCLRFARRHGFNRAGTHVACRRLQPGGSALAPLHLWQPEGTPPGQASAAWGTDLQAARREFEATFGPAGRVRCWLVHHALRLQDLARRLLGRDRLVFPLHSMLPQATDGLPTPAATIGLGISGDADCVSPLTGREPVRLIFSGPAADCGSACPIYYDPDADLAYTLGGLVPQHLRQPGSWPFAAHRPNHVWERQLVHLPCPRSKLPSTSDPRNQSGRLLAALGRFARPTDRDLRFLHAGCGDGELLRQLRPAVRWALAGTEARPQLAISARAGGTEIWETDLWYAAGRLPIGRSFDVIFFDLRSLRAGDLIATLRRLRQLLNAGGYIILTGPNLDSRLLDLFGPTWPGWHLDRPLAIPGRRGLAKLARMADLRLQRFHTFTDVTACVRSAQQNRLGRIASPPSEPPAPQDRNRGTRLAAWASVLWDWRGMGDAFYAVLQNQH